MNELTKEQTKEYLSILQDFVPYVGRCPKTAKINIYQEIKARGCHTDRRACHESYHHVFIHAFMNSFMQSFMDSFTQEEASLALLTNQMKFNLLNPASSIINLGGREVPPGQGDADRELCYIMIFHRI